MRFINSKFHAIIDYASGLFMLCLPGLIIIPAPAAKGLAMFIGMVILIQAMLTCYEGGIIGVIPLYVHLLLDIIIGLGLIVIPWPLGFTGSLKAVFIIMGILAILFGLFTRLWPSKQRAIP